MAYFKINGKEFSPCIISQVKYQLGLKRIKPINKKICSNKYWNEAVITVAIDYNKNEEDYRKIFK